MAGKSGSGWLGTFILGILVGLLLHDVFAALVSSNAQLRSPIVFPDDSPSE